MLIFQCHTFLPVPTFHGASIADFIRIGSNADTNYYLGILQGMAKIRTHTTFHTARHTCATLLCHQGVPITTVQKILGHTELATTQIYSEVMADTIVRDLAKVKKADEKQCFPVSIE